MAVTALGFQTRSTSRAWVGKMLSNSPDAETLQDPGCSREPLPPPTPAAQVPLKPALSLGVGNKREKGFVVLKLSCCPNKQS